MATIIKKGASKSEVLETVKKVKGKRRNKELLKLAGSLKADIDPLKFQKKLRDEWE